MVSPTGAQGPAGQSPVPDLLQQCDYMYATVKTRPGMRKWAGMTLVKLDLKAARNNPEVAERARAELHQMALDGRLVGGQLANGRRQFRKTAVIGANQLANLFEGGNAPQPNQPILVLAREIIPGIASPILEPRKEKEHVAETPPSETNPQADSIEPAAPTVESYEIEEEDEESEFLDLDNVELVDDDFFQNRYVNLIMIRPVQLQPTDTEAIEEETFHASDVSEEEELHQKRNENLASPLFKDAERLMRQRENARMAQEIVSTLLEELRAEERQEQKHALAQQEHDAKRKRRKIEREEIKHEIRTEDTKVSQTENIEAQRGRMRQSRNRGDNPVRPN